MICLIFTLGGTSRRLGNSYGLEESERVRCLIVSPAGNEIGYDLMQLRMPESSDRS